jgi:hypothetical protein
MSAPDIPEQPSPLRSVKEISSRRLVDILNYKPPALSCMLTEGRELNAGVLLLISRADTCVQPNPPSCHAFHLTRTRRNHRSPPIVHAELDDDVQTFWPPVSVTGCTVTVPLSFTSI